MTYAPVRLKLLQDFTPQEHTSASRLGLFMRCQRWFGFSKLAGLVEEEVKEDGKLSRPWLELGKEVEYYQQKYLEGYAIPQDREAGKRALASLHLLPNPQTCDQMHHQDPVSIDTTLIVPSIERFELRGNKDLIYRAQWDQVWRLLDYKTTRGNTRRKGGEWDYVKTEAELLADVQGNFYAWDMLQNHDQKQIPGRWVYSLTDVKKHPDARATDVTFTLHDTFKRMAQFVELADWHRSITREFNRNRARMSWEQIAAFVNNALRPNGEACDTFGGCPYRPANGGPCKQPSRDIGAMLAMSAPNGQPQPIEEMLEQKRREGLQAGAPAPYGAPPGGGMMPPPPAPMPPPVQQAPSGYAPGTVINGHTMGTDGIWHPNVPQQQPPPPPPMPPQAPPHAYQAPPSPVLPPEAYAPPPGPPSLPPGHLGSAPYGTMPAPAPPAPALPPQAAPLPPQAAPQAPKATRKNKAATPPGAPVDPADETDERRQFMRACVLACSSNADQLLASNPAAADPMAKTVVQYASLVWQYLQHAGA